MATRSRMILDRASDQVSITQRGLVPQAPNDAAKYLDGTGAFSTPSGSSGITQLTGDVTAGPGSGSQTATVGNLPTGVTQAGQILQTAIAAPTSPAAGKVAIFADSTDLRFHDKNAAGVIGTTVVKDTGTAKNYLTAISAAGVISKAQPAASDLADGVTGSGGAVVLATGPTISAPTLSGNSTIAAVTNFKGVATAGWGLAAIQAAGRSTGQVAAVASVATYTVGAADGTFLVVGDFNVTTATAFSIGLAVDYTDESNVARTATFTLSTLGGVLATAITNAGGTGPRSSFPLCIRCKAATAITVKTTGTFTTIVYNVEGVIAQLA